MTSVAIIAQGEMGAGIGRRLVENGVRTLTVLDGRSEASRRRAAAAGMEAATWEAVAEADLFLSVLPPGQALALAQDMRERWRGRARAPLYVDCNAVSPATARAVGEAIAPSGAKFVDAGIIGGPPRKDAAGPTIYASGVHAPAFAVLGDRGLDIRVLDGPIGAASALKMSYAGITKGATAIGAIMILAAERAGAGAALKGELAASQPALFPWLTRQCAGMIPKAYRFVAEMQEIAEFQGEAAAAAGVYEAIAAFYEELAADEAGERRETDRLRAFLK